MSLLAKLFGSSSAAGKLVHDPTQSQIEALLAAMATVGFADGELSQRELDKLTRQIDVMHWCDRMSDDALAAMLERGVDRGRAIVETCDEAVATSEVARIASDLATVEMREVTFAMAYAVAAEEGEPSPEERGALEVLAAAFDIPDARTNEVMAMIQEQLAV
jgi:tellurite resistance protein